jgi:hypothetical protein
MTDTTVTTSRDLGDPDSSDLGRLAASLDHLHAHFRQTRPRHEAALSPSDVCEPTILTSGDNDRYRDDLNRSAILLDSDHLSPAPREAA